MSMQTSRSLDVHTHPTCNGGQHVNRRGRVVELAAAVVGNDDPIGTQLHRFAGIIRGHDALWGGPVVQGVRVLLPAIAHCPSKGPPAGEHHLKHHTACKACCRHPTLSSTGSLDAFLSQGRKSHVSC